MNTRATQSGQSVSAPCPRDGSTPGPRVVEIVRPGGSLLRRGARRLFRLVDACRWRARLAAFGAASFIDAPAYFHGFQSIHIGRKVQIWRGARVEAINAAWRVVRISIDDDTVIQPDAHLAAADSLTIGKRVMIASRVYITDHDHDFTQPDQPARFNNRLIVQPVHIADDVWIGEAVIVLKGVSIGEHSVIGAGSVVTRSIPPYCMAAGVPARVIRQYNPQDRQWRRVESP